jgi:ribosomal protein S18 acetylase RimI-like enzyme
MIRPANAADAPAIAALEAALFGADAWTADQVVEELTGFGAGLVAEGSEGKGSGGSGGSGGSAGETVVWGYAVTRTIDDVSDLQRIAVASAYQRQGLAGELLKAALTAARSAGAVRMLLEVAEGNDAGLRFYLGRGFAQIDRRPRYYRNGDAAIVMALDLLFGENSNNAGQGR